MTIDEIEYRFSTKLTSHKLKEDLYLSSSNSSISSTETVCLDEREYPEDKPMQKIQKMTSVYNAIYRL